MNFTDSQGIRIWRLRNTDSYGDELLLSARTHTDEELAKVAAAGFTHVWLFGLMYRLMRSTVFPELNDPLNQQRLDSLRTVIDRARRHGLGVVIYFNDPIAIDEKSAVWIGRDHLKGQPYSIGGGTHYSLCTAQPQVQSFFQDAADSIIDALPGLSAVLLITSCEHPTHCWSKSVIRARRPPTSCPRCKDREPAESVLTLLKAWSNASRRPAAAVRIIAWNWEWAYWYEDPQAPITAHLPEGIELMLDIEIGGTRDWYGRPQFIGEYSLGYVGPSERFEKTRLAVEPFGTRIHAKIEINVTHEMASVPNIPVLTNIQGKLAALYRRNVAGYLGCWHQGSGFTLNTAAASLFNRDPERYLDVALFCMDLAGEYLGLSDARTCQRAWTRFAQAWALYPFSISMLYRGIHNDAPARAMSLRYEGKPVGRSFQADSPGDDLSTCFRWGADKADAFTIDEVIRAFSEMATHWEAGLQDYESIGRAEWSLASPLHQRHRLEELDCARMIGIQLRSIRNHFEFHRERLRIMVERSLAAPCDVPRTPKLEAVMRSEWANVEAALPLVDADPRLGFHRESQSYKYDGKSIRAKIERMKQELE